MAALRTPMAAVIYLDVTLVLLAAIPALALGAPALGYVVGGGAWIGQRVVAVVVDHKLLAVRDVRRRMGYGVASSMARVWVLACAILVVGVAAQREDGLTAALVIFGAFSVYFINTAFAHLTGRSPTR